MQKGILSILTDGMPVARRVLAVLMALAAGFLVARLLWLLVDPAGAVSKPVILASAGASSSAAAPSTQVDLMSLARANHFGTAIASSPVIPNAPETSLNLRLKGVRAIPDALQSDQMANSPIAIIQTPDQSALTYRMGDMIIDGVTLDRILPDRVLIMKGGALETLMMDSSASGLSVLRLPGEEPRTATQPRQSVSAPPAIGQTQSLLAKVDFQPVQSNGTLTGYRIQSRGDEADLAALGLKSGDVIVEIAGSRVGSADTPGLLAQLASANALDLTVERGGALQSISLSIPRGD